MARLQAFRHRDVAAPGGDAIRARRRAVVHRFCTGIDVLFARWSTYADIVCDADAPPDDMDVSGGAAPAAGDGQAAEPDTAEQGSVGSEQGSDSPGYSTFGSSDDGADENGDDGSPDNYNGGADASAAGAHSLTAVLLGVAIATAAAWAAIWRVHLAFLVALMMEFYRRAGHNTPEIYTKASNERAMFSARGVLFRLHDFCERETDPARPAPQLGARGDLIAWAQSIMAVAVARFGVMAVVAAMHVFLRRRGPRWNRSLDTFIWHPHHPDDEGSGGAGTSTSGGQAGTASPTSTGGPAAPLDRPYPDTHYAQQGRRRHSKWHVLGVMALMSLWVPAVVSFKPLDMGEEL